ncbi:endonuclease/exonuclease/phosphatase family protein [Thioclava sp. JE_KL1]|uniref:endonuclease/exonuclease/phosphatase family protein n=1 Tax=Thioclava sp. JE_KL1 TaxID=2651187 RepID=UPI0020A32D9B|nr:endonuclease/exonuclease/phosphatase family protein [Thioclava sp. JE_KL1]
MALPAAAESLRVATWDAGLSRRGPGLLLKDIRSDTAQVAAVTRIVDAIAPDVLLLTGIDWDHDGQALAALNETFAQPYPHLFAPRPNSGWPSGADLDGNGKLGEARDAQGYGRFPGQGGLALLSRYPIEADRVRDFSKMLWKDLPDGQSAGAELSPEALSVQRLSSTAHWDVPLQLPSGEPLHLLAFAATPPVFDGPEDRNGRRNRDESAFWLRYLDGELEALPPEGPVILLGDANLDPKDGEGRRDALDLLLNGPHLQDPLPRSNGARLAADPMHEGDPGLDTADYDGPGNLRLDYVLPSTDLKVTGAGVVWPKPGAPLATAAAAASRHKMVWLDIALP